MVPLLVLLAIVPAPDLPEPRRELRAVWVATVDNIDWPSKRGLPVDQQKRELRRIFDVAAKLHFNAVIFQVRPACDALYPSKIEPWSEFLTGAQGRAPSPAWDPLKFAIDEAHRRGMQLHAWFNPYRAFHPAQKGPCCETHIARTRPLLVKQYAKYKWLDPGEPEVRSYSESVVLDVVDRYDVDGIHIDDYFYPYPEYDSERRGIPFPDEGSYDRYRLEGGKLAKPDWRRENVNSLVRELYTKIKQRKRWVQFGISPFGIYRPGIPTGIKAGIDQYAELYADCKTWLVNGWCDYIAPQLYWKISQTPQAFPTLLKWWVQQNPMGRAVVAGDYASMVRPQEGKWQPSEIVDQIGITRDTAGAAGNVMFSMSTFLQDARGIDEALLNGPYRSLAVPPAMPWLERTPPPRTSVSAAHDGGLVRVSWSHLAGTDPVWWYFWKRKGENWSVEVCNGSRQAATFAEGDADEVAVAGIDRCGVRGPIRRLAIDRR